MINAEGRQLLKLDVGDWEIIGAGNRVQNASKF